MFEGHLVVPVQTEVVGMEVTVGRIDMTDDAQIVDVRERSGSCFLLASGAQAQSGH
jgi:hypothetical protein